MGLFTKDEMSKIQEAAKKSASSLQTLEKPKRAKKGGKADLDAISQQVEEYFKDSSAILIDSVEKLHDYIDKCIEVGYCAIDTETTGLDRIFDTIVGFSLYYPGGVECYVPNKHLIYIFDEPCKNQISYEDSGKELQRLVDANVKMIFANADYDLSMIYKDFGVDMCDVCYYDVILAWRCLKENEPQNGLKQLYTKYVLGGKGDPKKFTDFFTVDMFPYCKPSIAKLYAANDAKITYELFKWQLPYTLPNNPKCKNNHLEGISEVIWNLEFPMIRVCAMMHRNGVYFDQEVARKVQIRYHNNYDKELADLKIMVQDLINDNDTPNNPKRPFKTGEDFNPTSPKHVQYLCYTLLHLPDLGGGTGKGVLRDFALPQTDKILKVRSLSVLINSFVDKLIRISGQSDGRIHAQFKSIGADTGRMSSSEPNCIAEGTKVYGPGYVKNIEDIEIGDLVYCYDPSNSMLHIRKVTNKWYKGERNCVDVQARSVGNWGYVDLVCTPDHKILTQNRGFVSAFDLTSSDRICHLRRTEGKRSVFLYGPPGSQFGKGTLPEHQFIKMEYFGKPNSLDIHHIDGDHSNNLVSNLLPCTRKEHRSIHSNYVEVPRDKLPDNFIDKKYDELSKDDWLYILKLYGYNSVHIPMDYGTFQKYMKIHHIDYLELKSEYGHQCTLNKYSDEYILNRYRELDGSFFDLWDELGCDWYSLKRRLANMDITDYNHKVISVTDCGIHRVWDIEVEEFHTFVANELCVSNCQNIPSHATDIRHMFRATPGYVMFSSDYSQQEPKLLAYVSHSKTMCEAFQNNLDIYATIAAVAFHKTYEECLEFHPETGEYQPDGKERRSQAKSIVLGITYGRSTVTIGEQLFGDNPNMSDEDKTKEAQNIYDSVLKAFPDLKDFMDSCQASVRKKGYTETILGRRRHIPDMQLPRFEFKALPGYVNPDVDPLDMSTLENRSDIPERIVKQLEKEFNGYKYFGQVARRTKELYAEHIKVINNTRKITDATRQCVNGVVQGSAADLTKMAILNLESNERWKEIGGRLLIPVHDELICEVPMEYLEEGREILKNSMEGAGDFLPFQIRCDVETTLRWYGLSYPCEYTKPEVEFNHNDMSNMSEDNIKWIQYHLTEEEYQLPKFPDKDGNAPIGDAAKGVNGEISEEMIKYIEDYEKWYKIDDKSFINHIEQLVQKGVVDNEI